MKKKLVSILLSCAMVATLLSGCGGATNAPEGSADSAATEAAEGSEAAEGDAAAATETGEAEAEAVTTEGDPNGTHMEMW
ncbi:MAG: hypothetical protein K6G03_05800, partial [Lachnospiraceae bacterium]|nr:hypothetical protein [Lachnospiraceae bacterium]